ncbi:MAG: type II toxin-antitoxin system RelE/ParE family toxin [Propionibacteriaceae bacterium]|jgi:mRNA-degrading endonuclease RelE of RelBE toxin-antitoxin system|nr:type II toxin-antitoxin system RelE/ParE family toxin [Propionibacteriaceae bacterium]
MKYRQTLAIEWRPDALQDLLALNDEEPALADAALAAIDDLAHRRQTGKALGVRESTGDLSGMYRQRFDLPGRTPMRFRVIFEMLDDRRIVIWVIGRRARRSAYHTAQARKPSQT